MKWGVCLKKTLLILLSSIFFILPALKPLTVHAEAAPKYIPNPEVNQPEKPKLYLVEKRPVPSPPVGKPPIPGSAGLLYGLMSSWLLTTETGQYLYNSGAEKLEQLDYFMYESIENALPVIGTYLDTAGTTITDGTRKAVQLPSSLYSTYYDSLFVAYSKVGSIKDVGYSLINSTFTNLINNVPYPNFSSASTFYSYVGTADFPDINVTYIYFITTWVNSNGVTVYQGNYNRYIDGEFHYTIGVTTGLQDLLTVRAQTGKSMADRKTESLNPVTAYNYIPYPSASPVLNRPDSQIMFPTITDPMEVPAIVEIGDTKYWEVLQPNPDFNLDYPVDPQWNPEIIKQYEPVGDVVSPPIPDVILNPDYVPGTEPDPDTIIDPEPSPSPETGGLLQIDWSWWNWLKTLLQEILDSILALANLVNWINPFSDSFILKVAFIPSEGYFQNYWNDLYFMYKEKIPIIGQMYDFFAPVNDINFSETIPEFSVDLPSDMGGVKAPIIDFGFFTDYRTMILNFIRFIAWFIFLKRMFKYLPRVVY